MNIPIIKTVPDKREFWQVVDSTKLQTYCACPRKYFYNYVLGWSPVRTSNHLVFGQAWHAALEYLYKEAGGLSESRADEAYDKFLDIYRKDFPPSTDAWFKGKTPDKVREALNSYITEYTSDNNKYKVLDTEVCGQVAIDEQNQIIVRLDLIMQDDKGVLAMEHKTAGRHSEWWMRQWELSIQIGAYLHALMASYSEEYVDQGRIIVNGTFFTPAKTSFARQTYTRSGDAMLNWLYTVGDLFDGMERDFDKLSFCTDNTPIMEAFPMSPTACSDYGGCCYHDLCVCMRNPLRWSDNIPGGYVYHWWNPIQELQKKEEEKGENKSAS